jgi:hypothetical protein
MSKKSRILLVAATAVVIVAIAGTALWLWLRFSGPPKSARLLPEADAYVYVDLRPLRLASVFASLPPVTRDPDYQAFVEATGFEFERDLDEAAVAVHLPPSSPLPASNAGPLERETRFSEVFIGRFDVPRLQAYFTKNSKSVESAGSQHIFVVPVEDRLVRVALLSPRLVIVSNADDGGVIRGMIQQAHSLGVARGPYLVREHYKDVPLGSLAWLLARPGRNLPLPGGIEVPMPAETTWVGSLRYAGGIDVEAQALTANDQEAQQITENLTGLLALFHSIEVNTQTRGADPDVKALFSSLNVKQQGNRAIITATVPISFLKKLATSATAQ